jgi:hypothetical protein
MLSSKGQIITIVGKDVEKLEPSYIAGRNLKWGRYFGKQLTEVNLKRLNIELSYDPAMLLLGIYSGNTYLCKILYMSVHTSITILSKK